MDLDWLSFRREIVREHSRSEGETELLEAKMKEHNHEGLMYALYKQGDFRGVEAMMIRAIEDLRG